MTEVVETGAEAQADTQSETTAEAEGTQTTLLTEESPQESASLLGSDVDDSSADGDGEAVDDAGPTETTDVAINYDDLKVPEGFDDIADVGKELKLSSDKLTKLLDVLSSREVARAESAKAEAIAQEKAEIDKMLGEFKQIENHAEIANDAARFVKQFGGEELRKWFDENPLIGNNPGLVKLLGAAGSRLNEGKMRKGESDLAESAPAHKRMYPNSNF